MKNASPPCPLHKRKIFHAAFNLSSSRQSKLYVGFKYNLDNAGAKPCKRVTREDRSRQNIESDSTRAEARTIGPLHSRLCLYLSEYNAGSLRLRGSAHFCWRSAGLVARSQWIPYGNRLGVVRRRFRHFHVCLPDGHHVGCRLRSGNCASGS